MLNNNSKKKEITFYKPKKNIEDLLKEFGIPYKNIQVYKEAFTHKSYANEYFLNTRNKISDYNCLEFYGDAILYLVMTQLLFSKYANKINNDEISVGVLSKQRKFLIEGSTLTKFSKKFDFESYIFYSQGESNNSNHHDKVLEDVFEAFIGALSLDLGFEYAKNFLTNIFAPYLDENEEISSEEDSKSILQSIVEKTAKQDPIYEVVTISSNPSNPEYMAYCKLGEIVIGQGKASTKRKAKVVAAQDALQHYVNKENN